MDERIYESSFRLALQRRELWITPYCMRGNVLKATLLLHLEDLEHHPPIALPPFGRLVGIDAQRARYAPPRTKPSANVSIAPKTRTATSAKYAAKITPVLPGCRGIGGNGCPEGLICDSADETVGQCTSPPPTRAEPEGPSVRGGPHCSTATKRDHSTGIPWMLLGVIPLARRLNRRRAKRQATTHR